MKKILFVIILILGVISVVFFLEFEGRVDESSDEVEEFYTIFAELIQDQNSSNQVSENSLDSIQTIEDTNKDVNNISAEEVLDLTLKPLPTRKTLKGGTQIFQTFNNCGPASLSMALSHYDTNVSQEVLGKSLRPYQNTAGNNDDKSVTLYELAEESKKYGFIPLYRQNGNIEMINNFINYDIPVITRTWLDIDDDIGHYRVVKGFDLEYGQIIQDDSLQGKDLVFDENYFNQMWEKFNYEFLVLVNEENLEIAKQILGDNFDEKRSWELAVKNLETKLKSNPEDIYARFNLSVAYYNNGDYQKSISEFEKVEDKLARRTLWYQIEPIKAYYEIGDYQRVFEITDSILNDQNRAFSELYLIRGDIYFDRSEFDLALREYENAVFYNSNLLEAREAVNKIEKHIIN